MSKTKKIVFIFMLLLLIVPLNVIPAQASSGSLDEVNFDTIVPYNQRMIVSGVTTTATEFVSNKDWTVDYYPSVYWRPVIEGDTGSGGWEVPVSKSFNFIPRFHFKSLPLIDDETYNIQISYFFLAPYDSDITLPTLNTLNVGYYQRGFNGATYSISKQSSIKVQDDTGDIVYYKGYVGTYKGSFTYDSTYPFSELFMNFKFNASSSASGSIRFFGVYGAIIVTSDDTSIDDFLDEEENRAENSGNAALDDASSAVPDKSEGFSNAISTFVDSMSTTETDCSLKLPKATIPAIGGVVPETVLWEDQDIEFTPIFNMIPTEILELVRALATVALIIYCFKELYSTISYVLTLKGGGADE